MEESVGGEGRNKVGISRKVQNGGHGCPSVKEEL